MAMLIVGKNEVPLVLDTGSSQLSVKGDGCRWRSCEGGDCTVQPCPCGVGPNGQPRTDCSFHQYNPTGIRVAPGERGTGTSTVMTYGSQIDTIEHFIDTVSLRVAPPSVTCEQLLGENTLEWNDAKSVTLSLPHEVIVHRVTHISGSSSSNLLGLARPGAGSIEHGKTVVLDSILHATRVWSLVLNGSSGWLVAGALPCMAPHVQYAPLVHPPAFRNFLTAFYIVEIEAVLITDSTGNLRRVRESPRWGILDTGTTCTYGSPALGDAMVAAGYVEGISGIQIRLSGGVTLSYSVGHLRDSEYPETTIVHVSPGRTLDDFDQLFPESMEGVLLLGVLMFPSYMEFDLDAGRVGFCGERVE